MTCSNAVAPSSSQPGVVVSTSEARSILTPASGFMQRYRYTLNPYAGCAFGCPYCYARAFVFRAAEEESWGRWVTAKRNAIDLVAAACRSGDLADGDAVYLSSVTDPYQPIERRLRLTRGILGAILAAGVQPRLTVQTRSPLVVRDVDLLRRFEHLRVNVTVSTDSDAIRREYEPRCTPIAARFGALEALARAGVRIGVSVSPMLPIEDPHGFGARLAALRADEYVMQYLKPPAPRFAGGTSRAVLDRLRADGWGPREYRHAATAIRVALGEAGPLLEGMQGYAPA